MKHFEVQYRVGSSCFVLKTTSIADAFDAACDAVIGDVGDIDGEKRDEILLGLVELYEDKLSFAKPSKNVFVAIVDGEV